MFEYRLEENHNRFVVFDEENEIGEISFSKKGEKILVIDHTYIDSKWKGHSIGNELVKKVVAFSRDSRRKIIPLCPFAKKVLETKDEYKDVYSKQDI